MCPNKMSAVKLQPEHNNIFCFDHLILYLLYIASSDQIYKLIRLARSRPNNAATLKQLKKKNVPVFHGNTLLTLIF